MMDEMIESVERWAVRGTRVPAGHIGAPERMATGLVGLGLLLISRRDDVWRVPAAIAAGAALTRAATGVCPIYAGRQVPNPRFTAERLSGAKGTHIREQITIAQPIGAVFGFWRSLDTLAAATEHRLSVVALDERRSRWTVRSRAGGMPLVEWTAELINEVPDQVLGWRTTPDADVVSAGSVNFAVVPGTGATEVRVHLQYDPPLGKLGTAAATAAGHAPDALVRDALRAIKRYLEDGRAEPAAP